MTDKLRNCGDCNAKPGEIHLDNCDVERCSVCGHQKYSCDCAGHDKSFARWTGFWPGAVECKALGIDLRQFYENGYEKAFFIKPNNKESNLEVNKLVEYSVNCVGCADEISTDCAENADDFRTGIISDGWGLLETDSEAGWGCSKCIKESDSLKGEI